MILIKYFMYYNIKIIKIHDILLPNKPEKKNRHEIYL